MWMWVLLDVDLTIFRGHAAASYSGDLQMHVVGPRRYRVFQRRYGAARLIRLVFLPTSSSICPALVLNGTLAAGWPMAVSRMRVSSETSTMSLASVAVNPDGACQGTN